jgi:hypothetical protein
MAAYRPEVKLYWLVTALAAATIILVVANGILVLGNQSYEAEISQRQQTINQGLRMNQVGNVVTRVLAAEAVSHQDEALRDLLTQNGIPVNLHPTQPSGAPASGAKTPPPATPTK